MLERILREHMQLHGLVRALRAAAAAGDIPLEALRTLGDFLHDHVRAESHALDRGSRGSSRARRTG